MLRRGLRFLVRSRSRGQAMMEFALVAPIFFFVLFGIIEFGRSVYVTQMLANAAREGARYAIVHGAASQCPSGPFPASYTSANPCDPTGDLYIVPKVKQFAVAIPNTSTADFVVTIKWCDKNGGVDLDRATCPDTNSVARGDGSNGRNETVMVTVAYTYRPLLGIVPLPTFLMTGGSTLVINN
jgi:hypothetical protein